MLYTAVAIANILCAFFMFVLLTWGMFSDYLYPKDKVVVALFTIAIGAACIALADYSMTQVGF